MVILRFLRYNRLEVIAHEPDSDIDVLVSFSPDARTDLFDLVDMQDELSAIFARNVDLVCREGIERSHNYILDPQV